jgi:hypothetical protein
MLEIARSRIQRFKYRIVLLDRHVELARAIAFVGWIFIIGGLLGELKAGSKIAALSANIQECSDAKVTAATIEAGDASTSAKTAHEEAVDLLQKFKAAEGEIVELKAAKLPRRLSSDQKVVFRRGVTSFKVKTFQISCSTAGGNAKEPLDFELDFVDAIDRKTPVQFEYMASCNAFVGAGMFIPPIQVEAGADRTDDEETLIKALIQIGVDKKQIRRKPNDNRELLSLTIGPKPE